MANLLRLIVAALLTVVAVTAHALPKQPSDWYILVYSQLGPFATASAACAAYASTRNGTPNPPEQYTVSSTGMTQNGNTATCGVRICNRSNPSSCFDTVVDTNATSASCPANSTLQGNECVCAANYEEKDGQCRPKNPCPAGQHEQGGACVPDKCQPDEVRLNGLCVKEPPCPPGETRVNGVCKKNGCDKDKDMGIIETAGDSVTFYCMESGGKFCTARASPSLCVTYGANTTCTGTARLTGSTCAPGDGASDPDKPNKGNNNNGDSSNPNGGNGGNGNGSNNGSGNPGAGGSGPAPGGGGNNGGNGNNGNLPGTSNPGTGPNPTLPNNPHPPVGGGSGPGTGSGLPAPNPDGPDGFGNCPPGTTKKGKTCVKDPVDPDDDGKCPPGTVKVGNKCVGTYVPDGPSGGASTPGGGTPGGGNGDGDGDGNDSVFSGSCMQGFVCEGDAVQCAMAREQHRRACKLFEDESDHSKLYYDNKGKEGDQTKNLPGNTTESISGKVVQTDLLGGGSGVQDLQVTVHGQSISLPFSKINSALQALGNILLAVSLLAAVRIIGRG